MRSTERRFLGLVDHLVAIMICLVRSIDGYVKICGLSRSQRREFDAQTSEMRASDFLV